MADASQELLELEKVDCDFLQSNLLLCKKEGSLPRNKQQQGSGYVKGQPLTTAVPTSQVLGKVKDFLGVMAEANKKLDLSAQEHSHSDYDIEVLSGNETEYIEMDLLLGIADLHTPEAVAAAAGVMGDSQPSLCLSDGRSSSDTDNSGNDDSDNGNENTRCPENKSREPNIDESSTTDQPRKPPKIIMLD